MIYSMTGYGKSAAQLADKQVTIELRSLNSKGVDINVRLPLSYREKELEFRKRIADKLQRGKIDLSVTIENASGQTVSKVNTDAVRSYIAQLQQIVDGDPVELLKMAVRMPDALQNAPDEIPEDEYKDIFQHLELALDDLMTFRAEEGAVLEKDFVQRIQNIDVLLTRVQNLDGERLQWVRERLEKAVAEIQNLDANRFEQELIFYLEKLDITEEKIRLKNHLEYFLATLNSQESNGRKLGFIAQEIGREINTLGSKANHSAMQQLVVQMKDELEKIKEQVLNIL
ncbi:MAG: YicC/YloC family endoribonuclease [Capnocytophaga sp.]|nr:YicC/YloC family endoribonuclease [Capnocytophaga sp.]